MGAFANIQRLLDERLKNVPAVPFISWPNAETRPGNSALTQYVRPTLLLSDVDLYTLNSYEKIPGIYQVDIYGQLNRGVAQTYSTADAIKEYFNASRSLSYSNVVVLIQGISMRQAAREDSWYRVTLEINFICFNDTRG